MNFPAEAGILFAVVTPYRTINLFRVLFVAFGGMMGARVGEVLGGDVLTGTYLGLIFAMAVVLIDRLLRGFSLRIFSAATFGLVLGLILARLVIASEIFRYVDEETTWIAHVALYSVFGYLGTMLAIRSNREDFALIIPYIRFRRSAVQDVPVIVDTCAVIDGRLLPVCKTGFLGTSVVVPRFVLDELQALADSADPLKRERGQRGLDLLNSIHETPGMTLTIHESLGETREVSVDQQLVRLAQLLSARLLTNDANLARIARLEGIQVLSFHELCRAAQPIVTVGDEVELVLVKGGRDPHQAVGYLADGGMVVVNQAREQIGNTVKVTITSSLQTGSGRMYFAELSRTAFPVVPEGV